jgi:hypothetical protein
LSLSLSPSKTEINERLHIPLGEHDHILRDNHGDLLYLLLLHRVRLVRLCSAFFKTIGVLRLSKNAVVVCSFPAFVALSHEIKFSD